jgi:uroporphyrinogen decarboxylase
VGKPAVLHSCGNLIPVMDDIIDGMHYDGKHSYEDTIIPVEEAYARWGTRIAILGGLDVDYLCRTQPEAIHARAQAMVERSRGKGHYALGTGNSVPTYIPQDHFLALLEAGVAGRPRRALAAGQG